MIVKNVARPPTIVKSKIDVRNAITVIRKNTPNSATPRIARAHEIAAHDINSISSSSENLDAEMLG